MLYFLHIHEEYICKKCEFKSNKSDENNVYFLKCRSQVCRSQFAKVKRKVRCMFFNEERNQLSNLSKKLLAIHKTEQ